MRPWTYAGVKGGGQTMHTKIGGVHIHSYLISLYDSVSCDDEMPTTTRFLLNVMTVCDLFRGG